MPKPKLIVDKKTGELVEQVREDQLYLGLEPLEEEIDEETGDVVPIQFQYVLRSKLRLKDINRIFKCSAIYIKDQFGNVLWPQDWMSQLLPPTKTEPWKYTVIQRDMRPARDDALDHQYTGSTILRLTGVPKDCLDSDLRAWMLYGLLTQYDNVLESRKGVEIVQKKIKLLQAKEDDLPHMTLDGDAEQQKEMRRKVAMTVEKHKKALTDELVKAQKRLKRREGSLMSEPIDFQPIDPEEIESEEVEWYANFKSPRADELIRAALTKTDWDTIRFARKKNKKPVMSITDDIPFELEKYEINMRSIRLQRVRHGEGHLVELIESDTDVLDEDFHVSSVGSMYAGGWQDGLRHGDGLEYTNVGIYKGKFDHNERHGTGTLQYGKGDEWVGGISCPRTSYEYGSQKGRPYKDSLLNGDSFKDGVEHGKGAIRFADGAVYQGEMKDGRITGHGRYVSSAGVIMEGEFVDGQLNGEGSRREPNGFYLEGTWEAGQLKGSGKQISTNGDEYVGAFHFGCKHGRGETRYHDGSIHRGYWRDGERTGPGIVHYGNVVVRSSGAEAWGEDSIICDYTYQGEFIAGGTTTRHCNLANNLNASRDHLPFTTDGKSSRRMNYLVELGKTESKIERRRIKNAFRRSERELAHREKLEYSNLNLYYELLDEKFEGWAGDRKMKERHLNMTPRSIENELLRRNAEKVQEQMTAQMKMQKYGIQTASRDLDSFHKYIDRTSLVQYAEFFKARAKS